MFGIPWTPRGVWMLELVWRRDIGVGPHLSGTVGNGWAFLKLHRRTRDPKQLERARRFAMHAIQQRKGARPLRGRRRRRALRQGVPRRRRPLPAARRPLAGVPERATTGRRVQMLHTRHSRALTTGAVP